METQNLSETGTALFKIALKAGVEIMNFYNEPVDVEMKQDKSPVTQADKVAEDIILSELKKRFPDIAVIAEEAASEGHLPDVGQLFFLVDPLDGTREFIKRNGEFTVNIGLIDKTKPRAGIVYAPALNKAYYGERGLGAWKIHLDGISIGTEPRIQKIEARPIPENNLSLVGSRSHGHPQQDEFVKTHHVAEQILMGSSLKFCHIAEGCADIYPRFGRTMEWDTAAGQAVLEAAGGAVVLMEENIPLNYGKRDRGYDNPAFIAKGA